MPLSNLPIQTVTCLYGTEAIEQAADLIRQGLPVAVPTETVYGLAADATNGTAVARIYEAKGRPGFNPLIVHVLDLAAAEKLGVFDATARALAEQYWPGPLTLVVPRRADCPIADLATAGLDTIAIRVPRHRAMRALLEASGLPLAAPSANQSGRISATTAPHVAAGLNGRIAMVIDDGPTEIGMESTIIAVLGGAVRMLRPGPISFDAELVATDKIEAPGQMLSHYAPNKSLRINAQAFDADEYGIGFAAMDGDANLSPSGDLIEAAACLFEALHTADASGRKKIAVATIPCDAIGLAINDRLNRAASKPLDKL
jgi:L-threonylcarbamoyladenylate synthase